MKKPHWTAAAAILLIGSASVVAVISDSYRIEPLPVITSVPDFSLVDRSGETVSRATLEGSVWVADFIFTSCGGACPTMTGQMSALQETLPEDVRLVSFTVDPATDTPMVLASYADRYEAREGRWFFLTGAKEDIYTLAREGFLLTVDDTLGTEVEPIAHSTRFALIDREGQIRAYYDGTDPEEVARIDLDARLLLVE
jgi:protein SCO1/2